MLPVIHLEHARLSINSWTSWRLAISYTEASPVHISKLYSTQRYMDTCYACFLFSSLPRRVCLSFLFPSPLEGRRKPHPTIPPRTGSCSDYPETRLDRLAASIFAYIGRISCVRTARSHGDQLMCDEFFGFGLCLHTLHTPDNTNRQ